MVVLRTHKTLEGQLSWDQRVARVKDISDTILAVLFPMLLIVVLSIFARLLYLAAV